MSKERKKTVDEKAPVPGWIVSFSDMVTLLLAFFVLLQTFAHTRDPELFMAGQGSFRRAVSGFGMTSLFSGHMDRPIKDYRSLKYPTKAKEQDISQDRFDAEDEKIRLSFHNLQRDMDVKASDMAEESISVFNTPITFEALQAELSDRDRKYLTTFSLDLKQTVSRRAVKIYVIGIAADEKNGKTKAQWLLSARRAMIVQHCLSRELSSGNRRKWDVYSWGSGNGGGLDKTFGLVSERTHIAIVVMGANNKLTRR